MNNGYRFVEKITETESHDAVFNHEDFSAIEKTYIMDKEQPVYVLAFYTRAPVLNKASNCLIVHFNSMQARDNAYEEILSKITPTTFEGKWHPV